MNNTPDPSGASLPAWPAGAASSAGLPATPIGRSAWEEFPDPDAPKPKTFTPKILLRTIRRHWWQILLVWAILSGGLMFLAHKYVKPLFDVMAILQVEPSNRAVTGASLITVELTSFMETQTQLITSSDVLTSAIKNPKVETLPRIRTAADPELELKNLLRVTIPQKTHLIVVSMTTPNPIEGALLVNAVVDSYIKTSEGMVDLETRRLISQYTEARKKYAAEQTRLRDELQKLSNKGTVDPQQQSVQVALDRYKAYQAEANRIDLERIQAEAALRVLQDQVRLTARDGGTEPLTAERIDAMAHENVMIQPEMQRLDQDLQEALEAFKSTSRVAKKATSDPAVKRHTARYQELLQKKKELAKQLFPKVRQEVAARAGSGGMGGDDELQRNYQEARLRVAQLADQDAKIKAKIAEVQVQSKDEGNDTVRAQFVSADLTRASEMLNRYAAALEQLELDSAGQAKVTPVQRANAPKRPTSDNRLKIQIAAPILMLFATLALFMLIEARGGRVADPDDLPARVRVGVIGVVPPLPSLAGPRGPRALRDQRRKLEEFVQSLDHLRVTLCSQGTDGKRCVLITSAVGGEGKTTLAAQLAGRCANAGLRTLVVDADLRRPSLGELLEIPEGPGLVDILLGESTPEEAMVVVGNAGGFYLLPAGRVGHDPSRLLQGERLGQLVARLREAFDIVIIDAPPVLAVPDALLLGRWADGAVLAVRHDASRFPLVERANKRLGSIGIPVLGAVVNGVRPSESTYGAYTYYTHYADTGAPAGGRNGTPAPPAVDPDLS